MPIELLCPSCRKTLQVPDYAVGKKARCPGCGEVVDVPASKQAANPYAAPTTTKPTVDLESLEFEGPAGPLDIGQIWNHSWEAWKAQLGILVGATVVFMMIQGAVNVATQFGQQAVMLAMGFANQQQEPGPEMIAGFVAVSLVFGLIGFVIQSYFQIGLTRIALDVSRGQPTSLGRLFSGGDVLGSFIGFNLLFGIFCTFGFLFCIIPGIWMSLMWWPGVYLIVDKQGTAFSSFGKASLITKGNLLNCFVVFLIVMAVNIVGFLACCIGIIFSMPLTTVILATTYRMLAGDQSTRQVASPDVPGSDLVGDNPFA